MNPGLVEKGWLKKYPELYQELKLEWKETLNIINKQNDLASRIRVLNPNNIKGILPTKQRKFSNLEQIDEEKDESILNHKNNNNNHINNINNNNNNISITINDDFKESENSNLLSGMDKIPIEMRRPKRSHFCYELNGNVLKMFCIFIFLFFFNILCSIICLN